MNLIRRVQVLYETDRIDLPVAAASAATNWFYGGHDAAIEAIDASGEDAIEHALDAVFRVFGHGWRPVLASSEEGVLLFVPVEKKAFSSTLEQLRGTARH
jgi:hypothetical protein